MTLTAREKKLLLFLVLFGVVAVLVYYVYLPLIDEVEEQRVILEDHKAELSIVENSVISVPEQKKIIQSLKWKIEFLARVLPPAMYQESVLRSLMDLSEKHDVLVRTYSFSNIPEEPKRDHTKESLEIIINNYDDSLLGNISKSMIETRIEQVDSQNAQDEQKSWDDLVESIDVELSVEGSYEKLKQAMTDLETNSNLVIVKSYNFSKDVSAKDDRVIGNISLIFPYYYDNEKLEDIYWQYESEFNSHNPFVYEDSWKDLFYHARQVASNIGRAKYTKSNQYIQNSSAEPVQKKPNIEPDFYVMLNAPSSIQPRYLIGKSGAREMTLASSRKDERLLLTIENTDDGYGFRYKNSLQVFPSPAELYPFSPKYKDKIFVKVQSSPRIDNADVGVAYLEIENKTGKQIYLISRGEDNQRPRFVLENSGDSVKMLAEQ